MSHSFGQQQQQQRERAPTEEWIVCYCSADAYPPSYPGADAYYTCDLADAVSTVQYDPAGTEWPA